MKLDLTLKQEHIGQDFKNQVSGSLFNRWSGNRGGKVEIVNYRGPKEPEAKPTLCFDLEAGKAGPGWGDSKGYILSKFPKEGIKTDAGQNPKQLHVSYMLKYSEDSIFGWGGKSGISITFGDYSMGKPTLSNGLMIGQMWQHIEKVGNTWQAKFPIEDKAYFDVYEYSPKQTPNDRGYTYGLHQKAHVIERGEWMKIDIWVKLNTWMTDGTTNKDGEIVVCINEQPVHVDKGWGYFNKDVKCVLGMGMFHGGNQDWMSSPKMRIFLRPLFVSDVRPNFIDKPEIGMETQIEDFYAESKPMLEDTDTIKPIEHEPETKKIQVEEVPQEKTGVIKEEAKMILQDGFSPKQKEIMGEVFENKLEEFFKRKFI